MIFNKYQTPIEDLHLESLPQEVQDQFFETINNVEFIKRLISSDRKYARDLERDSSGKIIIDLTNPHIIEDMDYFRQPAIYFEKYGCYTHLRPNSNPNSEYQKYWNEELRRCWDGYVRESDGEWVTGLCYFYLNYSPIMLNKIMAGSKKASRVEGFPEFWEGCYWRFHYLNKARENGHHCIELARRGCSKSFSLASIMAHNLILGENSEVKKRVTTILTAYQKEYLSDKDGTLNKFQPIVNHCFKHTPFPHLMLKNSPNQMVWQMGYIKDGVEDGSLNSVMGVSSKDDESKLRGKRGWILFEEMGSFPNLLSIYDTVRYGVEEGEYTFGLLYLVGTSAEDESDFSSAKTLLYSPKGYNIQELDNVFDRPKQGKSTFGFFFPAYINRKGCYNNDGVSDVTKSLLEILVNRYNAKFSANSSSVLRVIAEMPITPADAIIKVKSAYFPVTALTERLSQLDINPHLLDDIYIGKLIMNASGTVEFKPTNDEPIRKYGVANDTLGALEIYEMPEKDREGKVFNNRYIIGHDPVDNDQAESHSLSSTFVYDLFTDKIVAEFTGRQPFADDNFEILRLLCIFYNALCLYEANIKGVYSYFSRMKCTHLLADTPEYLRDKQLIKYSSFGSSAKGVKASAAINNYANSLIKDWLMEPVVTIIKEDGEDKEIEIPRLYQLRNRALIEELIAFNPEINVDRIRAFGMVMLYRQEKIILFGDSLNAESRERANSEYLGNDAFFIANYDNRKSLYNIDI